MKAYTCDDCGILFVERYRGAFYLIRGGVGSPYALEGRLKLCDKCWNKMLKEVFKDLEVKDGTSS